LRSEFRELAVVFAIAGFVRLVYFAQYALELPFLYGPIADSIVYLEQSFRVRHGEFGSAVSLAFSPLYGYFLALFGTSLVGPVIVQLLLGCVTACVLYLIVFQLAGRGGARFATALFLGYGTLLYYESKILSESISLLLGLLGLGVFLGRGVVAGRAPSSVLSGALFGLAILARASLVFAAPLTLLAAVLPWSSPRESWRTLFRRAFGVGVGFALVLGGNGLLNYSTSGLFVPVILVSRTVEASSGAAFDGNLSSIQFGEGLASSYDVVESAKRRIADAQNRVEQAPSSAVSIDVAGWLANAPRKLQQTLTPREITFQYGFNGERDHVTLLQWLPVSFGVLLLWGVLGAVMVARERGVRALVPFAPLVFGVLVTTTLYHPSTRYRLAIILPLFVLAGVGFGALPRQARPRRNWLGGALLVSSLWLGLLHVQSRGYNRAEFALQLAMSAGIQGDKMAEIAHSERAMAYAPNDPSVRQRAEQMIQGARSQLGER